MKERKVIRTTGVGAKTLEEYCSKLFQSDWPRKLPREVKDWVPGAMYEVTHGFLTLGSGGSWTATFSFNSVVEDIKDLQGVTVEVIDQDDM